MTVKADIKLLQACAPKKMESMMEARKKYVSLVHILNFTVGIIDMI